MEIFQLLLLYCHCCYCHSVRFHLRMNWYSVNLENVGKIQAKEKAKYWIIKYLAFFLVPRPGVEPGWK